MFHVFMGEIYYPLEGWDDYDSSYPTLEEATEYLKSKTKNTKNAYLPEWWQIVSAEKLKVVKRGIWKRSRGRGKNSRYKISFEIQFEEGQN